MWRISAHATDTSAMTQPDSHRTKFRATGTFTIPPSAHAWQDMKRLAQRYWYIPVLPLLISAFGIPDWRGWIVALMILFVLLPIAALFAWIAVLGRKDAARAVYPQSLSVTPAGELTVTYTPLKPDADGSTSEEVAATGSQCPPPCVIPYRSITGHTTTQSYIIVRYTVENELPSESAHRLIIPLKAFRSDDDAIEFLRFLPNNLN